MTAKQLILEALDEYDITYGLADAIREGKVTITDFRVCKIEIGQRLLVDPQRGNFWKDAEIVEIKGDEVRVMNDEGTDAWFDKESIKSTYDPSEK